MTTDQPTNQAAELVGVVEVLREQVDFLREQLAEEREANRESKRIIAGFVQRSPELEAFSEPRDVSRAAVQKIDTVPT